MNEQDPLTRVREAIGQNLPMLATAVLPQVSLPFQTPKRTRALTPEQVIAIREAYAGRKCTLAVLAERYSISRQTAHRVARGLIYTDVTSPVAPPKLPWFDPAVRNRGAHSDDELRVIARMLRSHPGKWALVKRNATKPDGRAYEGWGLEASAIQLGGPDAGWGLYVRFPAVQSALAG